MFFNGNAASTVVGTGDYRLDKCAVHTQFDGCVIRVRGLQGVLDRKVLLPSVESASLAGSRICGRHPKQLMERSAREAGRQCERLGGGRPMSYGHRD